MSLNFFEMRFDLGTLDSGERSLPFGLLVSLPMYTKVIIYGLVRKFMRPLFIFWIIFLLDLELNFTDKL